MVDRVWRERRWVGVMLSGALVGAGLVNDARLVGPAEHTEHGILTRGASVRAAARRLKARGVRYVVTPYEIQWRLIFESDERVVATCAGVSLFERYPPYAEEVFSVIRRGTETYALVFRRDFAFVKLAARYTLGRPGPEFWMERIRQLGERVEREEVNDELVIYYVRPGKTRAEGR